MVFRVHEFQTPFGRSHLKALLKSSLDGNSLLEQGSTITWLYVNIALELVCSWHKIYVSEDDFGSISSFCIVGIS